MQRPGNYEVPLGFPLRTLIHDWAGGPPKGRSVQAVTMAGLSGGFLAGEDLEVTLDEPSIRDKSSFLGAGGIMVFDDSRDIVAVAAGAMSFFAHESCGKCFPCRIGTQRLAERLRGEAGPADLDRWRAEVEDIGKTMKATSACGLGMAAPLVTIGSTPSARVGCVSSRSTACATRWRPARRRPRRAWTSRRVPTSSSSTARH